MAFEVKFGKSDKRINSTKIPTLSETVTCVLKSGTSVEKPTFILQAVSPFDWNVAYCETFGRYYFVNDVTYVESTYEISCTCDYLASYKDEILANTAYVTRSSSLFDEGLADTLFPTSASTTIQQALSSNFGFSNQGSIILTTAGKNGNAFHALSPSQFSSLCNYLYSSTFIDALTDWTKIGDVITKQVFNTDDYIISACWVPVSIGGGSDSISLGPIDGCGTGTAISNGKIWGTVVTVTAPNHPQVENFKYRNIEPFSKYTLSIPYIGTIPIDGSFIKADRTISIGMYMDINGNITCTVFNSKGVFGYYFGSAGANVGFSTRSSNGGGNIVEGAGGLIASAVTGNALGAASGVLSLVSGVISSNVTSSGSGGCVAQENYCTLTCRFFTQKTVDTAHFGRPLCNPVVLSSLSGFLKCESADVVCTATENGKAVINDFLNGGMFIE